MDILMKDFSSYFTMDQLKSYFNGLKLDIVYENSQIFGKTSGYRLLVRSLIAINIQISYK